MTDEVYIPHNISIGELRYYLPPYLIELFDKAEAENDVKLAVLEDDIADLETEINSMSDQNGIMRDLLMDIKKDFPDTTDMIWEAAGEFLLD